jgi:hypothetical protein
MRKRFESYTGPVVNKGGGQPQGTNAIVAIRISHKAILIGSMVKLHPVYSASPAAPVKGAR